MEQNSFFATEKPSRLYFRVAIPGMISMLAMSLYSTLEGVFLGNFIGESAMTAMGVAFSFVMINFSLADLIGVGSSVQISIALGRKDQKRANNCFSCSVIMIFLAAMLMGIILFFASPALVRFMGAQGEIVDSAVKYIRVYSIFGPATTIVFAMDNYLRISGFVKGSMMLNIFMSLLTAGLVFLFIGVLGLDLYGSAFASCIAMTLCAIIAIIPFIRKKTVFRFVKPKPEARMIREIISCGMPVFLNNISGRIAAIFMSRALFRIGGPELGNTAVAAHTIIMYAGEIIQPMLYGLSDSVQPAVGYNWGARKLERVKSLTKLSFLACAAVSVIGTAVMFLIPNAVVSLFAESNKDPRLIELATRALRIFCLTYLFRWFGFAAQSFYSAIEKPTQAMVLSVSSAMIFPIIFIYSLEFMGLDGLWLNNAATSLMVMIIAFVMLRITQKDIKKDILK